MDSFHLYSNLSQPQVLLCRADIAAVALDDLVWQILRAITQSLEGMEATPALSGIPSSSSGEEERK
jgi:hypothetical protein